MRLLVLAAVIALPHVAIADDVVADSGLIEGVTVDGVFEPIANATVRIVGEALVMTTHSDALGNLRVAHLPPGRYRIEVSGGSFSQRAPQRPIRVTIDTGRSVTFPRIRCCICAMERNERFELENAARSAPPPLIDTHSTTLGVRFDRSTFGFQ